MKFDKYRDPRWQKLRLEIFQRDYFTCQFCGEVKKELHAHHLYYKSGRDPWDYPVNSIVTACCDCHVKIHSKKYETWEEIFMHFSLPEIENFIAVFGTISMLKENPADFAIRFLGEEIEKCEYVKKEAK